MGKYTIANYTAALKALLPPGLAFPRDPDTRLHEFLESLAVEFASIDTQSTEVVTESLFTKATKLIEQWEAEAGLPDECYAIPADIQDRRDLVQSRITMRGGASAAFWIDLGTLLGYTITAITTNQPFYVGSSGAGDPIGEGTWISTWEVWVDGASADGARLECVFKKLRHADTHVLFHYTS